jgi:hypothetical protein
MNETEAISAARDLLQAIRGFSIIFTRQDLDDLRHWPCTDTISVSKEGNVERNTYNPGPSCGPPTLLSTGPCMKYGLPVDKITSLVF